MKQETAAARLMHLPARLELTSVVCLYGKTRAVDGVDLSVESGEHVALIGSNGSGKTTLLRAVLGLHPLSSGVITLDGNGGTSAQDWFIKRKRIAWMPQRQATGQFPLLVHELLESSLAPAKARGFAVELGVGELLNRPLYALSGGQLQRIFLARALASLEGGAGLLLADEPTAALDFEGQNRMAELLEALPWSVLVVTHDRAMANRCNRVVEMAGGKAREVPR